MHRIYNIFFIFLGFILTIDAQEIVPISKVTVFNKLIEDNQSIKIFEEDFNQARADYRQTNSIFLPNITASHTGFATTNPLMAFGSKLNQEILTANDFDPILLNDPDQIQNFATKFEIQQPLVNMDGFYQRKAAKAKMDATYLQTQRNKDFLKLEVDKAYMQLQLAYKNLEVLEKALEAANANKNLAENSFKQGYLQRSDVLSVEVRVTEVLNQMQTAQSNLENASNYLSYLMNEQQDVIYKPTDSLTIDSNEIRDVVVVPEKRSDIQAMQLATEAYYAINKSDKMSFLPRLNAFGSYELYDDEIFQGDASGYIFGAQLSWDIFQGSKRFGKAQKSQAEFEKAKLQYEQYISQSNLELNKTKRMLLDAENRLELTQLALEQSKESLRIRTNRFEEGLEKTSDLLLSETQYAQKQLEYYQTVFEYNYTQAYLDFLTKE
ncbi:MAG: TolC family protein [Flavobacteriaceae bacterium]